MLLGQSKSRRAPKAQRYKATFSFFLGGEVIQQRPLIGCDKDGNKITAMYFDLIRQGNVGHNVQDARWDGNLSQQSSCGYWIVEDDGTTSVSFSLPICDRARACDRFQVVCPTPHQIGSPCPAVAPTCSLWSVVSRLWSSYLEFLGNLMGWLTLSVRITILACSTLHCSVFPDLIHTRAGFNAEFPDRDRRSSSSVNWSTGGEEIEDEGRRRERLKS